MYKYTHFIPENIAPIGTEKIGVYDDSGNKVCDIPLGRLKPPNQSKLYSFCAISDVHISSSDNYKTSFEDFQNALTYIENSDCAFTCICGDLTEHGYASQLKDYRDLVETYAKKPVYAKAGNHEHNDLRGGILEQYIGKPLYYSFGINEQGECVASDVNKTPIQYSDTVRDVFIMVGHAGGWGTSNWEKGKQFEEGELQWLYETLEANRNKRCFVFCHVFPHKDGVGNAKGVYTNDMWTSTVGTVFENLMKHYKNTVLFHGHSHLKFDLQEVDEKANYSSAVGYRSVHIPSLAVPRDIVSGSSYTTIHAESEGYIVDVYDDFIVLNGRDFVDTDVDGHWLPIATYKIDTTLQTVGVNRFADSTGTIKTQSEE